MVQGLKRLSGKLVVGLTGAFGTGKSTVAGMFKKFGAEVIDADKLAHEALSKESPVFRKLTVLLKEAVCPRTGNLKKREMAAIIFNDRKRRRQIEAVVHPYVLKKMSSLVRETGKKIVVLEVPLLFEAGFDRYCDFTLVVKASLREATKRLSRKGFAESEIKARQAAQMPLEQKIKRADAVICNSGNRDETKRQARILWEKFCAVSKRR
jgi:dephospho-CoA kinase